MKNIPKKLAEVVGCDVTMIEKINTGKRFPGPKLTKKLIIAARIHGIPLEAKDLRPDWAEVFSL